jgi:hypothetical protein
MKTKGTLRRRQAHLFKGDRLVGKCDSALKEKVARARDSGLDESKIVRLAAEFVIDALSTGQMVVQNGKLVLGSSPAPVAIHEATGTEG